MDRRVIALCLAAMAGCGSDDDESRPEPDAGLSDAGATQLDGALVQPDAGTSQADAALPPEPGTLCTQCGGCEETLRIQSALHRQEPIDYPDLPPAGGDHAGCWTYYGVHESERPDEVWVHNLEHGAVVFLYRCDEGCPAELGRLAALAERPFTIVMPYAALPTQFAVVAWGHRLQSECFDEAAFLEFYERNVDKAPESISADGSC